MRIHVHNVTDGPLEPVVLEDFAAFPGHGHVLRFGATPGEFHKVAGKAKILALKTGRPLFSEFGTVPGTRAMAA